MAESRRHAGEEERDPSWDLAERYDAEYYERGLGEPYRWDNPIWPEFFGGIADFLVETFAPRTLLDVGCGVGFLVDALRTRGVDARGVDISSYAISQVPPHLRAYCAVGSITDEIEGNYDLITCIEVLEHIPAEATGAALDNLTAHTDRLLFSSSPDDLTEPTHVNVRPLAEWVLALGDRGFVPRPDSGADLIAPQALIAERRSTSPAELAARYESVRFRLAKELEDTRQKQRRAEARLGELTTQLERSPAYGRGLPRTVTSRLQPHWDARYAHVRHGRILLRRTREVLAAEGASEVVRRASRWLRQRSPFGDTGRMTHGSRDAVIEARYAAWRRRHEPEPGQLERQRTAVVSLGYRPLVSVVVPVFDPPLEILRSALASALEQTYDLIEVCIANAGSDPACAAYLDELAARDERVKLTRIERNLGIAGNSNAALALASGEYVALLDHDDLLAPQALFRVVEQLNADPELDVLYSDEDRLTPDGRRVAPYLKPDWSPEFLHSYMWTGHLTVYRRSLVESLGGFRSEYDGSQDYDLMLRAAAVTDRIAHLPDVLYHWRMIEGSAAAGGKGDARRTNLAALGDAVAAQGRKARIVEYPFANRVVFELVDRALVSIVVPSDNLTHARACVKGILANTTYERHEIVVVTNSGVAAALEREHLANVRCVVHNGPFNFSLKCNLGAEAASGDYLLFLNDDVEPITEGWIESMLQYAQLPEVGGVSPKLLYADDTIQYAGLVTGVRDLVGTAFHTWHRSDGRYHSLAIALRNVSCLTGACALVRAEVFRQVGGWDAVNTPISHSDIDLSYRILDRGLRLVYTPFAELRHLGAQSRGEVSMDGERQEAQAERGADTYLLRRWGRRLEEDPFYPFGMRELLYEDTSDYRILAPPGSEQPSGWWQRPRVLLVCHDLSLTGAPLMLLSVAKSLQSEGMSAVVTAPVGGPLESAYLHAGIPVILDGEVEDRPERTARFMRGFDLVGVNNVSNWRTVVTAEALGKPIVWFVHEPRFGVETVRLGGAGAQAALRTAHRIVFPSQATARLYERFGGSERHRIVRYGIPDVSGEAAPADAFGRVDGRFRIAHVGSIEPRKGADVLVEALRRLPSDVAARVDVAFVGRRHDAAYASRLEAELGSFEGARLVGEASRAATLAYIRDADLLVCTSNDEATPVVLFEAMALGTAVLSSSVGGVPEIVRNGVDGEIVPVGDPGALAERIHRLADDPGLRRRLSEEGRRSYERSFTAERYASEVVEIVREALEETSARIPEA